MFVFYLLQFLLGLKMQKKRFFKRFQSYFIQILRITVLELMHDISQFKFLSPCFAHNEYLSSLSTLNFSI